MSKQFTRNGIEFTLRKPVEEDAERIILYAKTLFSSTDQVLTTPEEYTITPAQERIWINGGNTNPNALILVVETNNEIIALLDFFPKPKKKIAHTGEFGVSVHPDYQGLGIGGMLVEELLRWAMSNEQIEKVFLNVLDTNTRAIKLYKELGFAEEGRHVKSIKQLNGEYADILQMYFLTK